ncbi:MFS transporter [Clostridium pasteurianum]|uniref:Arabinose efflux permease family protein n=1 Tax=Clostridium pasteurianum BC1 TaxID=86416 RepID=R4K061_CLOPA|nr:MFS transporter [Clostridium pasteurianum]AGK96477.1 arabinose efflux permease family protein [Clostridium pasteurianum BC1]
MEEKINIKPIVFVLFMTIFIIGADTFIISPLVPTISKYFSVNASEAGLLVTAYSIGYAIFAFIFGPISDKIGRRFLLIVGLICFSVFAILCGFVNNFKVLFLLRILSGASASAALAVSQLLGVPIGAFIAGAGGWRSSFFALGITLAIIYFPKIGTKAINGNAMSSQLLTSLKSVLLNKHALSGLFVTLFLMFGSFGMYSFLGVWLSNSFRLTVNAIGSVIIFVGVGNLIGNLAGGFLADTFGKKRVAIVGMLSLSILLILLPYTNHNFILAMGCILLWFISAGISLSSLNSLIVGLVPSLRGTMMSLNSSFMYIGTTIGVAFNGIILNDFGFHSVGLSSEISVIISLILVSILVSLKKDKAATAD